MPSKQENDELYMGAALLYSKISKAKRAKVGAVLVTANDIVIGGVNGLLISSLISRYFGADLPDNRFVLAGMAGMIFSTFIIMIVNSLLNG